MEDPLAVTMMVIRALERLGVGRKITPWPPSLRPKRGGDRSGGPKEVR
ncbi:MAG: hypothetical protein N2Z74_09400 [Syntrophales bacterium]|nr:hypothetical protein [Syntrophales bacterium]